MILRVKLPPDPPHTVPIPTYRLVFANYDQGYALVSVPDEVHGLTEDDLKSEQVEATSEGLHLVSPSDATLKKIHTHFDERYKEHKGKFRVEPA